MSLADALALADLGFEVFPVQPNKRPYPGSHGKDDATADHKAVKAAFGPREDALVAVRMPKGTVAIDLDTVKHPTVIAAMAEAGFDVPPSASQDTQSGGAHVFYRTDGDVGQTSAFGGIAGLDTRTNHGYVVAWNPAEWVPPGQWALAPGWVYAEPGRAPAYNAPPRAGVEMDGGFMTDEWAAAAGQSMTTRMDIVKWLHRLADVDPDRDEAFFRAQLDAALAAGRIFDTQPSGYDADWAPWSARDMRQLAREGAKFAAEALPERDVWWAEFGITRENAKAWEERYNALFLSLARTPEAEPVRVRGRWSPTKMVNIMKTTHPPVRFMVPGLLPEGLAILAAPPKAGKSLFCYQLAVELALGGSVLGRPVPATPVLYLALEDGERRTKERIANALKGRKPNDNLEFVWESPVLGSGLEEEASGWLDAHPTGLLIIDVLSKVRPTTGGKGNAYDEDYATLRTLHAVAKVHPGSCILVVTHDRKQGAEDWMSKVTGTRGVTGTADTSIFIMRQRTEKVATFYVTGRDVEDGSIAAAFTGTGWVPQATLLTVSGTRQAIIRWLAEHVEGTPSAVAEGTGLNPAAVRNRMTDMEKDGQLVRVKYGVYGLPTGDIDTDEGRLSFPVPVPAVTL